MKIIFRKTLTYLVVITMVLSIVPCFELSKSYAESYGISNPRVTSEGTVWDCVYFGSYPQTEVVADRTQCGTYGKIWETSGDCIVDSTLYNELKNNATWDEYNTTYIKNTRYKRICREDATLTISIDNHNRKDEFYSWLDSFEYHYFKYEPIKWRVLWVNEKDALLLSDLGLDCQQYYQATADGFWEISPIRNWLNTIFLDSAFSSPESSQIFSSQIETIAWDDAFLSGGSDMLIDEGSKSEDKVFLLAGADMCNVNYGFPKDFGKNSEAENLLEQRVTKSSTFASARGAYHDDYRAYYNQGLLKGSCSWLLRNVFKRMDDGCIKSVTVSEWGNRGFVWHYTYGDFDTYNLPVVRPALHLNLESSVWSKAGTVSGKDDLSDDRDSDNGGNSSNPNGSAGEDSSDTPNYSVSTSALDANGNPVKINAAFDFSRVKTDKAIVSVTTENNQALANVQLTVPKEMVAEVIANGTKLEVSTPVGTISFDTDSLFAIGSGDFTLSIGAKPNKADTTKATMTDYSLTVRKGSKQVSKFGTGKVDVTLPIPSGLTNKNDAEIVYNDGKYFIDMNGSVSGNKITFETNHFSKYSVMNKTAANPKVIKSIKASTIGAPKLATKSKKITLTWKNGKGNTPTKYYIYRSPKKTKGFAKIATLNTGVKKYTDTKKLKKGKTYYYKVVGALTVDGKWYNTKSSPVKGIKCK